MLDAFQVRPVWVEVNLDAFAHNMTNIRAKVKKDALVTAVIKADAYGHGAVQVAPILLENGADRLAVATLEEAIELRVSGIEAQTLVLGATDPARAEEVVRYDLDQTVFTFALAKALSDAAGKAGKKARIHIKVDSGMGRIGFLPDVASIDAIVDVLSLPHLEFEGLFTHFATADETDKAYSREQFRRYSLVQDALRERGYVPTLAHVGNSATIIDLPEYHMDMVRAGIVLYGTLPSDQVHTDVLDLQPTMQLKARITNVKTIGDHETVSYGRKFSATGERRIATLPLGYADGYTRLFSNKTDVLVHGQRAPIVGSVCMDQCMIDVTDIEGVAIGDEVVLMGRQGDEVISPEELANLIGTISYEIHCFFGRRVPRVYIKDGQRVGSRDYLLNPQGALL